MALSRRTVTREVVIRLDDSGAFVSAIRERFEQGLEDGTVFAERSLPQLSMTLQQLKTQVAAL